METVITSRKGDMLTVCKDLQDVASIFRHCTYKTLWNTFDSSNNYQMPKGTIRFPFSGTRLQKLSYAVLGKYAEFANKRVDSGRWKNTWRFAINPEGRENGISMPLRNCPVAAFAKKHGYEHLMPLFCGSDFKVAERYGMRLIREHTEAEGFPDCDFWYLMADDAER